MNLKERKYPYIITALNNLHLEMYRQGGSRISRVLSWGQVLDAKFDTVENALDEMERSLESAAA